MEKPSIISWCRKFKASAILGDKVIRIEKEKTIEWLRAQDYLRLSDLKNYLQEQYDVVFESNQSYYNLFKEAGISWKKTQKKNPAKNDELVQAKRKEIEEFLAKWQPEIEAEKLT